MLHTLLRYEWVYWIIACIATVFVDPAVFPFFIALPIFAVLRYAIGLPIFPSKQIIIPVCGLLIMIVVSAVVTPDLAFSFRKIAGLLNGIGLFVALGFAAEDLSDLPVWLLLLFGCVVAGAGAIGADIDARIPLLFPVFRFFYLFVPFLPAVGRVLNPNLIAGALLLTLLPAIGFLLHSIQKRQFGSGILSAVCIAAQAFMLIIMQSRGALLALFCAVFGLIYLLRPNARVTMRRFGFGLIAVVLLLVLPIWPTAVQNQLQEIYFATLVKGDEGDEGLDSLTTRQEIWSRAADNIREAPFTGQGMNIFRTVANEPTPILESGNEIPHAHNWVMQIVLELGLPGMIFYGWLLVLAIVHLGRSWVESPYSRAKMAGYAAALLAFMIFGILDTISPGARPDFIFWLVLAGAFSL